jgi:hypothetical protein
VGQARRRELADLGEAAEPIRHGIVLPHASSAQNRVRSVARSTTHARSSATRMNLTPHAPASRAANEYGVSVARGETARPADEDRLEPVAGRDAAGEVDDLRAACR